MGEAADVIITVIDVVHKTYPYLTAEDFQKVVDNKLQKWRRISGVNT